MKNLICIYGGKSVEHDISVITGLQAIENIDREKYNIFAVYVTRFGEFVLPNKNTKQSNRNKLSRRSNKTFTSKNHSGIDKKSKASTNPNRVMPNDKNEQSFYRSKGKIKLLNLYNSKPSKDRFKVPSKPVRIEPNRQWYGNVRVITQKKLEELRNEKETSTHDTYSLFLKGSKLPQSLIKPLTQQGKIVQKHSTFDETFGKNSRRTKPTLKVYTMEELADSTDKMNEEYNLTNDSNLTTLYLLFSTF